MKNNVIVTGSVGFIGHHLVPQLQKADYYVIGIDDGSTGKLRYKEYSDEFIQANILTLTELPNVDAIIHLAAHPRVQHSLDEPVSSHINNTTTTVHLLELARKQGIKQFIYASSCSVYGLQKSLPFNEEMEPHPLNPYALQKYIGEQYCKIFSELYHLNTVCLRFFNVYGEHQKPDHPYSPVIAKFLHQYKNKEPFTIWGDGEQTRDFTYVGDVCEAILQSLSYKADDCRIFNIGSGISWSVNQVADMISMSHPQTNLPAKQGEIQNTCADILNSKRSLNWKPQTLISEWIASQL